MARVLVPLADGCEEIEAVTIIDLLRRAQIEVVVAGLRPGIVKASRGVQLVPDTTLDGVLNEDFDMVVLPGGMPGAAHLKADERVLALLKKTAAAGGYTAAICAAPMVLAEAGLLDGKQATSYPGFLDALPGIQLSIATVVQDGTVLTSRGPGTAMDFALTLIETLVGADQRAQVEKALLRPR
ncbi:MAG: DJ-1 family glyoxalase III [Gammaproteobacteria bacterium]